MPMSRVFFYLAAAQDLSLQNIEYKINVPFFIYCLLSVILHLSLLLAGLKPI
jgi:hypothetical protein